MSQVDSYEKEQEKLRQELEAGADEDAYGLPPEPEVNPEIYRDVEPLLFEGFVYQAALIGDVPFVFKSLNRHEFGQIQLTTRLFREDVSSRKFYDRLLAYAVWMVDGHNMLIDREENLDELVHLFSKYPDTVRKEVIRHVSALNRRSNRATQLSEAYAMELYSRWRWVQYRATDLNSPAVTG